MACLSLSDCPAVTYQVDGTQGNDAWNGLTVQTAWRTIQHAASTVGAGDEIVVAPGVYFEHVILSQVSQPGSPIVFRSSGGAGNTIVSGANPAIRGGTQTWTLEDASLLLYSTPLTYEPATVLADEVDLFAYVTLAELRAFEPANINSTGLPAPGPREGFAYNGGKLWVRLNATGKYGSTNPANHVMKVSPPRAGGFRGDVIQTPTDYNWSVQTAVAANVVIDGFTFESPGFTGVWLQAGGVTVRNSRFLGCRSAVRGWLEVETQTPPTKVTNDVIVQGCEFTQYPAFDDMIDVVLAAEALPADQQAALPQFFWWHRKGGARTSELGMVAAAGARWKFLNNHIHDTMDGLSFFSVSWSDQMEISGNFFHRLVDNAIETENHSTHLRAHDNYLLDTYEPVSYQPNNGLPYPASAWFWRNIIEVTPAMADFWRKPILKWTPSSLKIKPPTDFTAVGLDGFLFFNNTIHFPGGNAFSLSQSGSNGQNFYFSNNIILSRDLQTERTPPVLANYVFSHNVVGPTETGLPGPGAQVAGSGGLVLSSPAAAGLENVNAARFAPLTTSPVVGAGVVTAMMPGSSVDAGALALFPRPATFEQWRFRYFYDLLDQPASAPDFDADGDGVANVAECLFSSDPLHFDAGAHPAPFFSAGRLALSFARFDPLPAGLTWRGEVTDDLLGWAFGAGQVEQLPTTPATNGRVLETVRDAGGGAHRWLRLRVQSEVTNGEAVIIQDP